MNRFSVLFLCLLAVVPRLAMASDRVTVFAAASLRGVLEEIAESTPGEVSLSFGGSGTIARQVAAGAPADVVVLASTLWMDWLAKTGFPFQSDAVPVATNRLVLIAPAGAPPLESLDDLPARLGDDRLAMGHRTAVPAGAYAQQWLTSQGLWDSLADRLAETDNVRAALAFVARGAAPFGIVYASDAVAEPAVVVLAEAAAADHAPIVYPAVALTASGQVFLDRLRSPEAAAVFAAHGFGPVP